MHDGPHAVVLELAGEDLLHHLAVGQHVGDAAGHAQVVLQHQKPAIVHPHQVGSIHGDIDAARHIHPAHLATVVPAAVDHVHRHHAILNDLAVVVDVAQEEVERNEALAQPLLDDRPLAACNDAGNQVVGENAFCALGAAVNGERDALVEKRHIGGALAAVQLVNWQG